MDILGLITGLAGITAGAATTNNQFSKEKEMMGLQAQYNKEQAKYSTELQKEIWNYTNYENQVKHLKAAGLNPALLYGKGGGGGATTGSAQAAGVNNTGTNAVAMGLQMQQMLSNIRLTNAQADKAKADADKTRGVDTEFTKAQTEVQNITKGLIESKIALTDEQANNYKEATNKLIQETRLLTTKADIAEETKETQINQAAQDLYNSTMEGVLTVLKGELTERQTQYINEQVEIAWYNAITGRRFSDAAKETSFNTAKRITEEIKKWGIELDNEQTRIIQEWVSIGINGISEIGDIVSDILPTKKAGKIIETVFTNNSKGNWKTSRKVTTKE